MNTALPPPSWIALGQSNMAIAVTPDRSTSPQNPSSMALPTNALQLPSLELGKPEKLQVHPGAQLQNSYPFPRSCHLVVVCWVVAMFPFPSGQSAQKGRIGHQNCAKHHERSRRRPGKSLAHWGYFL